MLTLNALIVDDEAPARSELRYLLEQTQRVTLIEEASSAREAVDALIHSKDSATDALNVIFLDISMPKTSGMQLAAAFHKLNNPPALVFVTAYSEYALEAFDVDAVDYLMKPIDMDRLQRALDKVEKHLSPLAPPNTLPDRLPVEKGGRKVLIPISTIRYIEARDDYTCVYTFDERFLSTVSLAKFEARLAGHGFFRVHRGYIVNLNQIEDVEVIASGVLQLGIKGEEDIKIPVSRRRVVTLKRALGI